MSFISYPKTRLQRLRSYKWSRDLFAETDITPRDFIQPLFVVEGHNTIRPVSNIPDIYQYSIDHIVRRVEQAVACGIRAVMIFAIVEKEKKSYDAKEAFNQNNLICRTIKELKKYEFDIGIIADVALDPYTLNGHDGITDQNGNILNDKTIQVLCKQSKTLIECGCDIIAPSDMMDGRIQKIREMLEHNKFFNKQIVSYSAKYASNLYGPFRNIIGSKECLKSLSKQTYQMDYRNSKEAISEVGLDISEGADAIIIKPGMLYLDIVSLVRHKYNIPIITYQVSGEYAMIKIAEKHGILDAEKVFFESFVSFKRAGACSIITYAAIDMAHMYMKT